MSALPLISGEMLPPPGGHAADERIAALDAGRRFGAVLREYRVLAGLTQPALAERAGVERSYVQRIEAGNRPRPSQAVALALAQVVARTSYERDALLATAGYLPRVIQDAGGWSGTLHEVCELFSQLPPGGRIEWFGALQSMAHTVRAASEGRE